jgi:hypothetical protein
MYDYRNFCFSCWSVIVYSLCNARVRYGLTWCLRVSGWPHLLPTSVWVASPGARECPGGLIWCPRVASSRAPGGLTWCPRVASPGAPEWLHLVPPSGLIWCPRVSKWPHLVPMSVQVASPGAPKWPHLVPMSVHMASLGAHECPSGLTCCPRVSGWPGRWVLHAENMPQPKGQRAGPPPVRSGPRIAVQNQFRTWKAGSHWSPYWCGYLQL